MAGSDPAMVFRPPVFPARSRGFVFTPNGLGLSPSQPVTLARECVRSCFHNLVALRGRCGTLRVSIHAASATEIIA